MEGQFNHMQEEFNGLSRRIGVVEANVLHYSNNNEWEDPSNYHKKGNL